MNNIRIKDSAIINHPEIFQSVVAHSTNMIIIFDVAERVLYANEAAEKMIGYKAREIIGRSASKLWGGLMDKEFYQKLWKTIKINKLPFKGEMICKRKSGEEFQLGATIIPLLNEKKEIDYYVEIGQDITKEKEIDLAKTEFVSLASHQLRTPLSTIKWYTEMLLDGDAGKVNKEQKKYIKEIFYGNERMVELVNSLLNVSRIELGTFMVDPAPTSFKKVTDIALKELKFKVISKKLAVKRDYQKGLPLVNVDPKLIRIVIQNLLTNAVKYTPNGGKINVSIKTEGKNIVVKIADSGYGIPKEQQK